MHDFCDWILFTGMNPSHLLHHGLCFINLRSLKTTWLLQFSPTYYLQKKSLRKINGLVKIEKGEKLQNVPKISSRQRASQPANAAAGVRGYLS